MSAAEKKPRRGYRHVENRRLMAAVYTILRLSVLAVLVAQFFNRNFENVLLCLLTLVLFMLPSMFERRLRIDLPDTLEIIILLFIYAAEILGEIREILYCVPLLGHHAPHSEWFFVRGHWVCSGGYPQPHRAGGTAPVSLFHGGGGVLLLDDHRGDLGVFRVLYGHGLPPGYAEGHGTHRYLLRGAGPRRRESSVAVQGIQDTVLVLADGTTMAMGLGGYLDIGIVDTMQDLLVNFIGAVVFSTIGFFFVKSRGKGRFARRFIPVTAELREEAVQEKHAQEQAEKEKTDT